MRLTIVSIFFCTLVAAAAASQEIRIIDLTGVTQPPIPFPRDTTIEGLSCFPEVKTATRRVRASLEWLSSTEIHPTQQLAAVIKLENVGDSPVTLPSKPQFYDAEAIGSSSRHQYETLTLELREGLPSGATAFGWWVLYGSASQPSTMLTIMPGQWIRVKGEIRVNHWFATEETVAVDIGVFMARNTFPRQGKDQPGSAHPDCIQISSGSKIAAKVILR